MFCIKLKSRRIPTIKLFTVDLRSQHGCSDARTGRKPLAHVRQRSRCPRRLGVWRQGRRCLSRHPGYRDAGSNLDLSRPLRRMVGERKGFPGSCDWCRLRRLARFLLHEACRHERRLRCADDPDPDRRDRRTGHRHCRRRRAVVLARTNRTRATGAASPMCRYSNPPIRRKPMR